MLAVAKSCACPCHNAVRGSYESAVQLEDWPEAQSLAYVPSVNAQIIVDADNVIEAAVASGCPCLANHVEALGQADGETGG